VDAAWLGWRVTGDTMLGCGRCDRCRSGRHHLCANRSEVGIRNGRAGALAERLAVPASSLHAIPASVDDTVGAMVEPGANAWRAVEAAGVGAGGRLLVVGTGTIGLLVALMARARDIEVHLAARRDEAAAFATSLGFTHVWRTEAIPELPFDAVVDASNAADVPGLAVDLVEAGGRVVWIGLAGQPSRVDSRRVVLKDVTVIGILSGSPGLEGAIALYGSGVVDPAPLVAGVIGLDDVAGVLAGTRPPGSGAGPKIHVDPRR
jgi:threonine dehydrogenase-like Zn-dependent dehydrogenase